VPVSTAAAAEAAARPSQVLSAVEATAAGDPATFAAAKAGSPTQLRNAKQTERVAAAAAAHGATGSAASSAHGSSARLLVTPRRPLQPLGCCPRRLQSWRQRLLRKPRSRCRQRRRKQRRHYQRYCQQLLQQGRLQRAPRLRPLAVGRQALCDSCSLRRVLSRPRSDGTLHSAVLAGRAAAGPLCYRLMRAIDDAGNVHAGASGQQRQCGRPSGEGCMRRAAE
jgi:hypothetical protein